MPRPSSIKALPLPLAQAIKQATAMHRGDWLDEAEKIYAEISKVAPGQADALHLLGLLYRQYGRLDDALRLMDKALALTPDDAALLRVRADMIEPSAVAQDRFAQSPWRGDSDLAGKTVLLRAGQSLRETLQFVRYAGAVAQQGARVILEVPEPLRRLVASSFPDMDVVVCGETLPSFDLHAPLDSLPASCGKMFGTPLWWGPYLEPAVELLAVWARELPSPKKLRVGIVWADKAAHGPDHVLSLTLPALHDIMSLPQIAFVSLQHDLNGDDGEISRTAPSRHTACARLRRFCRYGSRDRAA